MFKRAVRRLKAWRRNHAQYLKTNFKEHIELVSGRRLRERDAAIQAARRALQLEKDTISNHGVAGLDAG